MSERKAGRYSFEKQISFISNTRTWDVRTSLFQSIWETSKPSVYSSFELPSFSGGTSVLCESIYEVAH